jgi:putative sigma-54 modulation protein
MNLEIKGIHYNVSDTTLEFFDKKLQKLSFAQQYIHDLTITITKETAGQGFKLDGKVHFSWGLVKVVSTDCYELYEGIELLVDKLEATARKEKGKIQEHK